MPKKPPKNGYFYFMRDFKAREERRGRRFPGGMAEVSTAASDDWKRLSQEERDEYNRYAKEHRHDEERENVTKSSEKKFNSLGVSFAQLEREEAEKARKQEEIRRFLSNFVRGLDKNDLKNKMLHLIHVNIFCKTAANAYLPAELAICKFTMEKGIVNVYHTFVDPGDIPTGYSLEVREHSEKFHKIKLDFVRGKRKYSDLDEMYNSIINFLKDDQGNMPPLFTMYDDVFQNTSMTAVEMTLKTLWQSCYVDYDEVTWKKIFPVYPLPILFKNFKNKCYAVTGCPEEPFPNDVIATAELNKDTYNFEVGYACQFHQDEDVISYCSRSYVLRWAHIIRDHCCPPLEIPFIDEPELLPAQTTDEPTRSEGDYDEGDDDAFTDCRSEYSVATAVSARTNQTYSEASVAFSAKTDAPGGSKPLVDDSSNKSTRSAPTVWRGANQKPKIVPSLNNVDFPALGLGRGVRKHK